MLESGRHDGRRLPMEYATFGRTGATVSRIGFGGATLGLTN
jgi:hypothetical protein